MPSYETIVVDTVRPHMLCVTMNRPEVGNARNTRMGLELLEVWTGRIRDPGDVRCVILTGAGDRIFCSGADLKERNGMSGTRGSVSTRFSSAAAMLCFPSRSR